MAERMDPGQVGSGVGKVTVTLLDSGEVFDVQSTPGNDSIYICSLPVQNAQAQLRLDFGALDERGHPLLKAYFVRPDGSHAPLKFRRGSKRSKAHHTRAVESPGPRTYVWVFDAAEIRFTAAVTWVLGFSSETTSRVAAKGSRRPNPTRLTVTHDDGTTE